MEISTEDLKIQHPATIFVSGPTGSGKSVITQKLIENIDSMFNPVPEIVYFCYSEFQTCYMEMKTSAKLELHEGIPNTVELQKYKGKRILLVMDDLMAEMGKKSSKLTALFTKFSHHNSCSLLFIVQNLFYDGLRSARVNSHYLFLTKNPGDQLQIQNLSRQLFPKKQQFLVDAYSDATAEPYGYLFISTHQLTPDIVRIRTNIFPGQLQTVYTQKA